MNEELLVGFFLATVRTAIPVLIAAIGETFTERSGVLNLGLDGIMLAGAFSAFTVSYFTANLWLGVMIGIVIGAAMGLLMAFMSVTLKTNQVINGLMLGILSYGLVTFLLRIIFSVSYVSSPHYFSPINVPILSEIPVLGQLLFQWNPLTYLLLTMVPISAFVLYKTTFGLKVRAVGENPEAADIAGINVSLIRYVCIIIGGIMAALGGVYFSLAYVPIFTEQGLSGWGWIALALVIFGRWNPWWIFAGSMMFSFVDALQIRLQYSLGYVIPFQFLGMLPYVLPLVALAIRKKMDSPKSLGHPYSRE